MSATGPELRAASLRLVGFYIASFAVLGVYLPHMQVWLKGRGCSAPELGLVLSAPIWVRVFAGPMWAQWVDRTGRHRRALRILSWGALACFAFFGLASTVPAFFVISLGFGFLYPPINSLTDSLTFAVNRHRPLDYGRVRLWGSLSFLLCSVAVGWAWQAYSFEVIYWLVLAALLACGVAAVFLPEVPSVGRRSSPSAPGPVHALIRQPRFLLFIGVVSLIQGSHGAYYGFASVYWKAAGISGRTIGLLWAEGVAAEIALFAASTVLLLRLRATTVLMIGAAGAVVRWVVLAETTAVPGLVAAQWLHALSFGCTHLAAVRYIASNVAADWSATAQSLMGALAMGASTALTILLSGVLFKAWGGGTFWVMAAIAGMGGLGAVVLRRAGADSSALERRRADDAAQDQDHPGDAQRQAGSEER